MSNTHLITLSFILSILVFLLNNNKINIQSIKSIKSIESIQSFPYRLLSVSGQLKTDFDEVCKKSSDKFQEIFKDDKFTLEFNSLQKGSLVDFLDTMQMDALLSYAKSILIYVVFILFGVLTIFFWIFYCCFCLCCHKCCCWCFCCNIKTQGKCYDLTSFILTILCSFSVIVISLCALLTSNKFIEGINGAFCGIFKFYYTTIEGEEKNTFPKWGGIDSTKALLGGFDEGLNKVNEGDLDPFLTNLTDCPNNKDICADNNYSQIKIEKCLTLVEELSSFKNLIENYNGLAQNKDGLKNLDDAKQKIDDIEGQLKAFEDLLNMINSLTKIINSYLSFAFLIIFVTIIGFSAIFVVLIFLQCICPSKCCGLRILFHFIWNLMCLLTVFTFIIGGIFGIFGSFGKDGAGAFYYIMSIDNLNTTDPEANVILLGNGEATQTINRCLNEDGDLSISVGLREIGPDGKPKPKGDDMKGLDNFDEAYSEFQTLKKLVKPPEVFIKGLEEDLVKDDYLKWQTAIYKGFDKADENMGDLIESYNKYASDDSMYSALNCSKKFT